MEYIVSVEKQEDADEIERTYSCERLIRCKDCEMRKNNICHNPNTFGAIVTDVYFCADGKAKAGENK